MRRTLQWQRPLMESESQAAVDTDGFARLGIRLIAGFCWVLAAYLLWTGFAERTVVAAAERFETVRGEVVDAGIKSRGGTEQSAVRLLVAYEVAGQPQRLQTSGQDVRLRFAGEGEALLSAYPIGREVEVYYDPQAPEVAALTRVPQATRAWSSGWVTLILAAMFSFWVWRRR